ncbi:hypothetical protein EVAR_94324_1 [Eumeta japonica]|uniref:Uncharacterized protein n=1 Tax=Eumeta variegata TaxID=151549 RepID=A0A4C1UFB3_EUMVA|nr:hypothetical protein EVAR_94324_1 [Eumeta japonica]
MAIGRDIAVVTFKQFPIQLFQRQCASTTALSRLDGPVLIVSLKSDVCIIVIPAFVSGFVITKFDSDRYPVLDADPGPALDVNFFHSRFLLRSHFDSNSGFDSDFILDPGSAVPLLIPVTLLILI